MSEIIVVAHNIRSTHNIGSIFRTADGLGVSKIILSGYSPYPVVPDDIRLPHISHKLSRQIHKTALGAEDSVAFEYQPQPDLDALRQAGYQIVALEQDKTAVPLDQFQPAAKLALLLGEEVDGISSHLLDQADVIVEIPMHGQKESFNVSVAAAIALYQLSK